MTFATIEEGLTTGQFFALPILIAGIVGLIICSKWGKWKRDMKHRRRVARAQKWANNG